jgi:hypothetical protein
MKKICYLFLIACCLANPSCSDVSPNAVDLTIDFSWQGVTPCSWGNPEINIEGLPDNTKALVFGMYDHAYFYDHGEATIAYDGSGTIKRGASEEIYAPCPPPDTPGRYKITVKALDGNDKVIGIGSKERYFPEEK